MNKIKKLLLYGGYEKEEYLKYKDILLTTDVRNLSVYLIFVTCGFFILSLSSYLTNSFARVNLSLYLFTAITALIVFLLLRLSIKLKGYSAPINAVFIYLFMAILYAESIALTTLHTNMPSVSYIGVLLILPLLFAQSPIYTIISQSFFVGIFCIFMKHCKLPEVASIDLWNGITFLGISIAAIIIVIPMRIKQLIQHEIVSKLSETDLLTMLRNRNAYELEREKIEKSAKKPICIYADANGLHELNNLKGHEAGDKMLQRTAAVLRASFGADNTYRIGGDEFAVFVFNRDKAACMKETELITEQLSKEGYSISFGIAAPEKKDELLHDIVKRAEKQMYKTKAEYYNSSENGGARNSRD